MMKIWQVLACTLLVHYGAANDEARLVKALKRGLSTETRPVRDTNETLTVAAGMSLIRIDKMEESTEGNHGDITLSVWMKYMWTDMKLRWDPKEYGGVNSVRLPIKYMWRPDIFLYNGIGAGMVVDPTAWTVVSSDGTVNWIPMTKIHARCDGAASDTWWASANSDYSCSMKFGSWTYDGLKMDLDFYAGQAEIEVNDLTMDRPWVLMGHAAEKKVKTYPCCPEPYPSLIFTLVLRRE